jgi:hypothetical protein
MSESGAAAGSAGPVGGLDALVDGAFAAMEADGIDLGGEGLQTPAKGKQATKPKPEEEEPGEGQEGAEGEELELEGEEPEDEELDTRGTKDDPISVKDLPEDKFIKLKIDGKEEIVSLRELADGHIREQTFRAKMKEVKDLPAKIDALKQEFGDRLTGTKSKVNALLGDAKMLFQFYGQDPEMEAVGVEFAKLVANQLKADKENPLGKQQRTLQRQQEKLRQEREDHERTTREREQHRQTSEAVQRRAEALKPAWEGALREAGFPAPTQELYDLVNANVATATKRTGKPISPEEFKAIAVRAIKFLDLKPGGKKPAPAAKPTKTPEERKKAVKNPHKRGSVDALIFGLPARRF